MDERNELLERSWEGEIVGEAFFSRLADVQPADAGIWAVLARLEQTMGALIAPVARAHGVHVDTAVASKAGRDLADGLHDSTRDEILRGGLLVVEEFLALYRLLCGLLPETERELGDELVAHEQALAACFEAMLAGTPDPIAAVGAFLARHGAAAPAG
ncbi:MAG: hypothetical protein ACYDA2_08750 [Acidimicrobiales bacterium]